ncbi:hypothetical protein [Natronococcus sp. A-GB7]|uniref:hypothetical protein n=1 Tax=Natronococcus sp. A-GB7 TaxID=3037649 RepID=UPI00241F7BFF|nr:hypothetical protein [Natronococcus sp. A-GB7]MDG5819775.1 hypothetical protein [Natronococcus sp. A-GB7]
MARTGTNTRELLGESIEMFKLLAAWSAIAVVPLAYYAFVDSDSVIGLGSRYVGYFVLVLGGANVLLYVIARGISLARTDRV